MADVEPREEHSKLSLLFHGANPAIHSQHSWLQVFGMLHCHTAPQLSNNLR